MMRQLINNCCTGWLLAAFVMSGISVCAQTEYTLDGAPTALEEEFRWLINRGRFDSAAENSARGTSYTDIPASCGPLAPHLSLTMAARHHADDMAVFGFFSHTTETSQYYSVGSTFHDRRVAEGYTGFGGGEIMANGFSPASATSTYLLWWNSTMGHRPIMYDAAAGDIGAGYAPAPDYYYVIEFGLRQGVSLFTGTLFDDDDGGGDYDQGEGVSGIKVVVSVGGVATGWYDVSGESGNFAVPLSDVPLDVQAKAVLQNTNSYAVTVAVPVDYAAYNHITLAGGESVELGTFIRTSDTVNLGIRDVTAPAPAPVSTIWRAVEISWPSQTGTVYQVQWASVLDTNQWYALSDPVVGNGETNSVYSRTSGTSQRFFRVIVP